MLKIIAHKVVGVKNKVEMLLAFLDINLVILLYPAMRLKEDI